VLSVECRQRRVGSWLVAVTASLMYVMGSPGTLFEIVTFRDVSCIEADARQYLNVLVTRRYYAQISVASTTVLCCFYCIVN